MKKLCAFFVCLVLGIGRVTITHAAEVKLIADDTMAGDNLGRSVSISGDYAIVGAPFNDDGGKDAGSAYIFFRDGTTWKEQAKLVAGDPGVEDNFGYAVAIDEDYAIIGAWAKGGDETGAAYIFFRSGTNWKEQAKLTASDSAEGNFFAVPLLSTESTPSLGHHLTMVVERMPVQPISSPAMEPIGKSK